MGVVEDTGMSERLRAELALGKGVIFSPPGELQETSPTKKNKHGRMFARIG